jgi:UDP-N-acetylmuramoylalanine--D-glutamate ligase
VILIGDMAPKIKAVLHDAGFEQTVDGGKTMASIVSTAKSMAQPGDVVLLSTACASFGLFQNYKDRGEQFKAAVLKLS